MTNHNAKIDTKGTFAALATLAGWSLGPIFIALIAKHLDFWTQNAIRYSIASAFCPVKQ